MNEIERTKEIQSIRNEVADLKASIAQIRDELSPLIKNSHKPVIIDLEKMKKALRAHNNAIKIFISIVRNFDPDKVAEILLEEI